MASSITWQELASQPARWRELVRRAPAAAGLWHRMRTADRIVVFGSGSSYYLAALVGETIQRVTGRPVLAAPSCEILLDPDRFLPATGAGCVAVGFSRSGESSEGVEALTITRQRGIPVLAVTCTQDSSLAREATEHFVVPEGQEDGMVMLRSFTCMLLACRMALGHEGLGVAQGEVTAMLAKLSHVGRALLDTESETMTALASTRPFNRFVLLGSGTDYALAQEAALKLQEMATVTTEPYYTLEYRHGPRSTGDVNTLAVLFAPARHDLGTSLVQDLSDQGLATLVIGADIEPYRELATATIAAGPGLPQPLRQIVSLLPVQMLAFAIAVRTGQNPDAPRNLAKVVLL